MAVEQNSDQLNEISDAWFEELGDAQKAWDVVARCIDTKRTFPAWILKFLRDLAEEPPIVEEPTPRLSKAYYDPMEVFSVISRWRQAEGKKPSLQDCFERYINEILSGRGEEETIKTTYYRGAQIAKNELAFMESLTSETTTSMEKTAWAGLAKSNDL